MKNTTRFMLALEIIPCHEKDKRSNYVRMAKDPVYFDFLPNEGDLLSLQENLRLKVQQVCHLEGGGTVLKTCPYYSHKELKEAVDLFESQGWDKVQTWPYDVTE